MDLLRVYPFPESGVVGRLIEGEAVLVLTSLGQVKVLNEVGARIWSLADGSRTIREIARLISAEYEVELMQAEKDTEEFILLLHQKGILGFSDVRTGSDLSEE